MLRLLLLVVLCYAAAAVFVPVFAEEGGWKNLAVQRSVDLTAPFVVETMGVSASHSGAAPLSSYRLHLPDDVAGHVALLTVQPKRADNSNNNANNNNNNVYFPVTRLATPGQYEVTFPPVPKDEKLLLTVKIVYTHLLQPLPKEIPQEGQPFYHIALDLVLPSPYPTAKTKTTFVLPTENILSYTPGGTVDKKTITYGYFKPEEEEKGGKKKIAEVHFQSNAQFFNVDKLRRTAEVSHWGANLNVEEFYEVTNTGPILKGHYSRLDHQAQMYTGRTATAIEHFQLRFPADAHDVYYRDVIGNISTSHFRPGLEHSLLEMRPRFPLFGGWHVKWYHGFDQPLSSVLQYSGSTGSYVLELPLVPTFDNAVIDEFIFQVVLPEGAHDIHFHTPHDFESEEVRSTHSYLDTYGRPTLELKKANVVPHHNSMVYITYKLATFTLLREPLLLSAFFLGLFLIATLYVRLDLSISKNPTKLAADSKAAANSEPASPVSTSTPVKSPSTPSSPLSGNAKQRNLNSKR